MIGHKFQLRCFLVVIGLSHIFVSQIGAKPAVFILGDSISTGAVTHPQLRYDEELLARMYLGSVSFPLDSELLEGKLWYDLAGDLSAPQQPRYAYWEYRGFIEWIVSQTMLAFSQRNFNSPQLSWGYHVARSLGYQASDIYLGAENGARLRQARQQLARLLYARQGQFAEKIFVFFTGNDICAPSLAQVTQADEFYEQLEAFGDFLMTRYLQNPQNLPPIDIYLISYLGVLQLSQRDEIREKKVKVFGKSMTCAELSSPNLRQQFNLFQNLVPKTPAQAAYFKMLSYLPVGPAEFCPTVFMRNYDRARDQVAVLANRIRAYRKALDQFVDRYQAKTKQQNLAIQWHVIKAPEQFLLAGEDIAADCFHLSMTGQLRLGRKIFDEIINIQ